MNKEDKIMDKVNKNLNIINDLLMENDFYKYINKLVTIEDCISQLYDDYKLLKVQNQKYYDKDSSMEDFIDKTGKYVVIGYFLRSKEDIKPYIEWRK